MEFQDTIHQELNLEDNMELTCASKIDSDFHPIFELLGIPKEIATIIIEYYKSYINYYFEVKFSKLQDHFIIRFNGICVSPDLIINIKKPKNRLKVLQGYRKQYLDLLEKRKNWNETDYMEKQISIFKIKTLILELQVLIQFEEKI